MRLEICVEGVASAIAAARGGADRVELCENLAVGGVTPGAGAIRAARARLAIPMHVLIRPRGGDFVPDEAEFEAMRHDVAVARLLGADGVVLGVLSRDGTIDRERSARLIDEAKPLTVTFHRAFDATPDPAEALGVLIELGVERVLTSGRADRAVEAADRLAGWAREASGRIGILPGGGVRRTDLPALAAIGLVEAHVGSAACGPDGRTDSERVAALAAAARSLAARAGLE